MKKYRYICALAALASLTACSDDKNKQEQPDETPTVVKIDAEVGRHSFFSRANIMASDESQRFFSQGDIIAVSNGSATETYTYGGEEWTPAGEGFKWGDYSIEFKAWYPSGTGYDSFTLPVDQSTKEKLTAADYMTANRTVDACPTGGVLLLDFNRHMSRVVLNVSGIDKDNGSIESVTVRSANSGIPADGTAAEVRACDLGDGLYVALIVPGDANPSAAFVTITTSSGKVFTVDGVPATEKAKSYSFDMYLGKSDVTLGTPIVEDWQTGGTLSGVLTDITDEADPGYYVTPEGRGDKSGSSWDNALDLKGFRDLIHCPEYDKVNGMTIYLSAGDYDMFSDYRGETTLSTTDKKAFTLAIYGGYDPASTGNDISKRDIRSKKTIFSRSATDPGSKTKFFWAGNGADITVDGIYFEGGYDGTAAGNLLCFDTNNASLTINGCEINGFANTGEGAAVYAQNTKLRISNSVISNCACEQGAVASRNGNGYHFLNNVAFIDNAAYGTWGISLNSKHPILMNNVTMRGDRYIGTADWHSSPMINANGDAFFMVNSSFYSTIYPSSTHEGVIRLSLSGGGTSYFLNNIIGSSKATTDASFFNGDGHKASSLGYNVYMITWPDIVMGNKDLSIVPFTTPTFADNCLDWGTSFAMPAYAKLSDITSACLQVKSTAFPSLGAEFAAWVGDDFAKDCKGNDRNISKMYPGALDPGL